MPRPIRIASFLMILFLAAFVSAQSTPPADTLKVDYFANGLGSVDETLHLTNPGTSGGDLCAAIYVFDAEQEMTECCSCLLTPDGLRTISVNKNLLADPLVGVSPKTGSISIVSIPSPKAVCPTYPTSLSPVAGIRAWGTHLQNNGTLTETQSQDATLSASEEFILTIECYGIQIDGSGHGLCSCGTGDAAEAAVQAPAPFTLQ
jgi:hypothetical protein